MAYLHYDNLHIAAMAGVVPEHIQKINMDPGHPRAEYIKNYVKQTGITQRHISITEQTSTDLGFAAINLAMERAGWSADSLDALVFVGQFPDFNISTGNAYVLHNHLKMRPEAFALDIGQGCAGFPYGMSVCGGLLQQPAIKRLALVSGDTIWGGYKNREQLLAEATFLPGEGSIAALLEIKDDNPIDLALYSDGSGYHFLYNPFEGVRHAWRRRPGITPGGAEFYGGGNYMDGLEITTFSTMRVVDDIKKFLAWFGRGMVDYDYVVFHQANMQILKTMARRLKIPKEKFPTTIGTLANTNVASAPLTLVDALGGKEGKKHILLSAFGVGLSWGIMDFYIDAENVAPIATSSARFDEDFLKPLGK